MFSALTVHWTSLFWPKSDETRHRNLCLVRDKDSGDTPHYRRGSGKAFEDEEDYDLSVNEFPRARSDGRNRNWFAERKISWARISWSFGRTTVQKIEFRRYEQDAGDEHDSRQEIVSFQQATDRTDQHAEAVVQG